MRFVQGEHLHLETREEIADRPHRLAKRTRGPSACSLAAEDARLSAATACHLHKRRHLQDYQNLFDRVSVNLNSTPSTDPTHVMRERYQQGEADTWLEDLLFQYGRYLLIASSREKTLPANLQGTWSQYYWTSWTGGYWHNINVQMNYWGAMSANLSECFQAYIHFFEAYLPLARRYATDYVKRRNPHRLDADGDNGWIIGNGANAYYLPKPGGHSGPGTGGFTSKLLIEPAASPEQNAAEEQLAGMPGHRHQRGYYITSGCTFDQGFVWENYNDPLALAGALGNEETFLDRIRDEMTRLDPIQIGASGQIKEYREEEHYSDIGDPRHRHISHLCPLYPGTLISARHEEWENGSFEGLVARGNFVLSAAWKDGRATRMSIRSGSGGECWMACVGIESAPVRDGEGARIKTFSDQNGRIRFATRKGEIYTIDLR